MLTTKDYSIFDFLDFNRPIDSGRLDRLAQSIKEHGFILPILVNNDMLVIDGQHRLEAAKKIMHEVKYIVCDVASDKLPILVSTVNSLSKNWKIRNYFNMWKDLGKAIYLDLGNLEEEYKVNISNILILVGSGFKDDLGKNSISRRAFKEGNFCMTSNQRDRLLKKLEYFKGVMYFSDHFKDFNSGAVFNDAIVRVVNNRKYDHDRMMKQLDKYCATIRRSTSRSDYMFFFEIVYNKGYSEESKLRFSR